MIMGYKSIPERFFDIVKMKEHVENQKNGEDKIRKLKKSKVLICNDANDGNEKRLLSRSVGTTTINGSEIKNPSTSENELIRIYEDNIVLKKLNETKEIKKTVENGPSTTRTYKDNKKQAMTNEKGKQKFRDDEEDIVPDIFRNNVGTSYVRNSDSGRIGDGNKNDVRTEAIPNVSQVDVVRSKEMKMQRE